MKPVGQKTLLVTGAAGGLARIVGERLCRDWNLVGADPRPLIIGQRFPGQFYRVDYSSREMAELFRQHHFDALLHLGRIRGGTRTSLNIRFRLNVFGTMNLLNLALQNGVKTVVTVSTFHVYGAHPHNHLYIDEEEPLRATQTIPELADAVEMDHEATTFLWKNPSIHSVILRPVNIIGPRVHNSISTLFRSGICPVMLGYDPLLQFIHEDDMVRAIELCLGSERSGIYNVAGEGVVHYTKAIRIAACKAVPLPGMVMSGALNLTQRLGFTFPVQLVNFFRYSTVVSDQSFRRDLGYEPSVATNDALSTLNEL